jgi:hypothetical protein
LSRPKSDTRPKLVTNLTLTQQGGDNARMATNLDQESRAPAQFSLRSLFLATAALAVILGLLRWLGPAGFDLFLIVAVQCSAVIAVLAQSRGTAWPGVVIAGLFVGFAVLFLVAFHNFDDDEVMFPLFLILASFAAWIGGGLAASQATKKQSSFLRLSWLLALVWSQAVTLIHMIGLHVLYGGR